MRSYIQSTRSPKGKPVHSQSPIQKKKLMKFVNQTIKHEKSMQGLSVVTNNNNQNSPPIEGFKQEIERRFQSSETNCNYIFPRKLSDISSSPDDSFDNLKNMREYDLHTQNFREKILDDRIESFLESAKKRTKPSYQSAARVLTSPTKIFDDSKISAAHSKLGTLATPKDQETVLYKKVLNLVENNTSKDNTTFKFAKTPKESSHSSLLRQEFQRKIKLQRNEGLGQSQSTVDRKGKPHLRAKSLLKETAVDNHKTFNFNLETYGNEEFSHYHPANNRSEVKAITLEDDDKMLVYKNLSRLSTTKSCKDLKGSTPQTSRQLDKGLMDIDSKIQLFGKPKVKSGQRGSQRPQKSLMDDYPKSLLANRTSDSIVQKPEKRSRNSKGFETRNEENSRNESSGVYTHFTEGPSMSRESVVSREFPKSSLLQKIQESSLLKAKMAHDFRSPTHVSLKNLAALPLTARNENAKSENDHKMSLKTPLASYRSPKERKIVIPLGASQARMLAEKTISDKLDSDRHDRVSAGMRLTKTNSAVNISQGNKSVNQFQRVPALPISKKIEADRKENRNSGPASSRGESKHNQSKREMQLMLKRNGPLSERYHLDESEVRMKSYHK